ncbi:DUF423 domain-containing protein [Alkalibacillus salilacus]|uniref:Uncharacterized membrane protein YgdD (TMEM256/DUF423 family) n=1 Tax=Alkalibacillus salilacus TaxID=284582 RepID=A0ABT9VAV7_9BACI|nr:DUF423 domain-containing protein [Alkalibacillus salilacus]MDQ0158057.1 uncharacterized membrane protein YgdD (TMEM256/DUF423 family) [Alkalibacillus salilacus]
MKLLLIIGAISGFITVALGAFGAHGLESRLSAKMMDTWEKAVQYQMFHTTAIFVAAILALRADVAMFQTAGWFFIVGILIFSGSLYIYSLSGLKVFGMITPIGGLAFLVGWAIVAYAVTKIVV